jgi:hypothetical protein
MRQLDLFYRRPSKNTREAMCRAAMNLKHMPGGRYEEMTTAEKGIINTTGHDHVKIVNSGNSAILAVMSTFKGKILIPDQGGWTGFKKMAEFLGIETKEVSTELGVMDTNILAESIKNNSPEALFITSFAGYTAEQPVREIYEVCDDLGVTLVEDASGSLGDETGKLASGKHAHVIVASTGAPKTVNVGSGGFISTNDEKILGNAKNILKTLKSDPVTCAGITEEIKNATNILSKTLEACEFLKKELKKEFDLEEDLVKNEKNDIKNDMKKDFSKNILHADKRGINIAISTDNPKKTGYELRKSLKVQGGNIVTVCPRYERIMADAVCIEIKNLDVKCLGHENLNEIIQIIKKTVV